MRRIEEEVEVEVWGHNIPVYVRGSGSLPLLVVGPADLFRKQEMLPSGMDELFTLYFVDFFSNKITLSKEKLAQLTLQSFINTVESIRDQLKLNQLALFAHSALGVLAYEYAISHSDNVSCLLMVAAAPIWTDDKEKTTQRFFNANASQKRKERYQQDRSLFSPAKNDSQKEQFVKNYTARRALFFFDIQNLKISEEMWHGIEHSMPLVSRYFELIKNYNRGWRWHSRLRKRKHEDSYRVPTFLALGLYDSSIPFYTWIEDLKAITDKCDYFIFDKAGHYPMMEDSGTFMKELGSFLSKQLHPTEMGEKCFKSLHFAN
jgi:proline iminopeptidase